MKKISVSITPKDITRYPLHRHNDWEIMYYLSGQGYLATNKENISFEEGSIIIVPPLTTHGSVSESGFVNISISGDFNHLFMFDETMKLHDNQLAEGESLAKLIFSNRYANTNYLSALCSAYIYFILQNIQYKNRVDQIVAAIITEIAKQFSNPEFDITTLLKKSGYTEDYMRAEFKRITTKTPIQFLTQIRMEHARKLFEIYGEGITVTEVSEACGFNDICYFSKRFKQYIGISPDVYRKNGDILSKNN